MANAREKNSWPLVACYRGGDEYIAEIRRLPNGSLIVSLHVEDETFSLVDQIIVGKSIRNAERHARLIARGLISEASE